MLYCSLTESS